MFTYLHVHVHVDVPFAHTTYLSLQLMQRIESFKALKRQQVDMANRLEFYCTQHTQSGTYCMHVVHVCVAVLILS